MIQISTKYVIILWFYFTFYIIINMKIDYYNEKRVYHSILSYIIYIQINPETLYTARYQILYTTHIENSKASILYMR